MRIRHGATIAALALALLAGCAEAPATGVDDETTTPSAEPTPTPTATTAPAPKVFRMPQDCAGLLTAATRSALESSGLELLGGPDGKYGENYFGEPTPEERAGGITCVWGEEDVVASTVIVSVAPITTANRSGIVSTLISSGLIESEIEGGLTYARIGDEMSAPAELHVIRTDSWISVIQGLGGEDRFQQATELVDEATAQVYVAG